MFGFLKLGKTAAAPVERRRAERRSVSLPATIALGPGRSLACRTIDLSSSGARLSLARAALLPQTFELHVPSRGMRRSARLVWRVGEEIGVQFV